MRTGVASRPAVATIESGVGVEVGGTPDCAAGVPQADGAIRVEPLMDPQHVADAIVFMAGLPLQSNVQFLTIMATKMPFVGRG